jgi:hypothetical protein
LDLNTEKELSLREQIESLSYVEAMKTLVGETEDTIRKTLTKKLRRSKLEDLLEDFRSNNKFTDESRKRLRKLRTAVSDVETDTIPKLKLKTKLFHLIERESIYRDKIDTLRVSHKEMQNTLITVTRDTEKLKEKRVKMDRLKRIITRSSELVSSIEFQSEKLSEAKLRLEQLIAEYETHLEDIKICPICFSEITDTEHVIKELRRRYEIDPA